MCGPLSSPIRIKQCICFIDVLLWLLLAMARLVWVTYGFCGFVALIALYRTYTDGTDFPIGLDGFTLTVSMVHTLTPILMTMGLLKWTRCVYSHFLPDPRDSVFDSPLPGQPARLLDGG